jgi:hypothetical protein
VARNGNLAIGQPRDDVAGAVGGAEVQKFDASVAQLDHVLVGEGDFRLAEPGEEGLVFQAVMCGGQDLGSAFDEFVGSVLMHDAPGTLFLPVGHSQCGMTLAVLQDNELDSLRGDIVNFLVQRMCQRIAEARVDEDYTVTRDADVQFVVVAGVLIGGGLGGGDGGPDAVGDLFRRGGKGRRVQRRRLVRSAGRPFSRRGSLRLSCARWCDPSAAASAQRSGF